MVWWGSVWFGVSVSVRKGLVCFGKVGSVKAVGVRCGVAGYGSVG